MEEKEQIIIIQAKVSPKVASQIYYKVHTESNDCMSLVMPKKYYDETFKDKVELRKLT